MRRVCLREDIESSPTDEFEVLPIAVRAVRIDRNTSSTAIRNAFGGPPSPAGEGLLGRMFRQVAVSFVRDVRLREIHESPLQMNLRFVR